MNDPTPNAPFSLVQAIADLERRETALPFWEKHLGFVVAPRADAHAPPPATPFPHSPRPWSAHPFQATGSGAVVIEDGDGEIIGWATDAAGHTTEDCPPDRRDPAQTLANARLFVLAPVMLVALRQMLLAMDSPNRAAVLSHPALLAAEQGARDIVRALAVPA